MKLEQLNKSKFPHDSLGELAFHLHFREQIKNDILCHLLAYFCDEVQIDTFRIPILKHLEQLVGKRYAIL
jgi:hypothetical protein